MPIFIKQAISQGVRNQGHQGRLEALIESFSEVFLFKVNLQKKIQSIQFAFDDKVDDFQPATGDIRVPETYFRIISKANSLIAYE